MLIGKISDNSEFIYLKVIGNQMRKILVAATLAVVLSGCQTLDLNRLETADLDNRVQELKYQQKLSAYVQESKISNSSKRNSDWRLWQTPIPNAANYDLWERIRSGFKLDADQYLQKQVKAELNWFARHQDYLDRVATRASLYMFHIVEELEKNDLPLELALLPIVESAYEPYAYSHGKAAGLWQFIPSTGRLFGMDQNHWYDARRDIITSTTGAIKFLNSLKNQFGDWLLGLAAYNSGNGRVSGAIKSNRARGKGTSFWSLNLPKETRAYVPKLLALAQIVANPEKYGVRLKSIPNHPYFKEVDTHGQIDLAFVADLADMDIQDLYRLNPALNRWATNPQGPHRLLVPYDIADNLQLKLDTLQASERMKWAKYSVKSGDTLLSIANKYKTTTEVIRGANQLNTNLISAGKQILVPIPSGAASLYASEARQKMLAKEKFYTASRIYYKVRKGDSLWSIARKYKVTPSKLASWNRMSVNSKIYPGKRLVILRR